MAAIAAGDEDEQRVQAFFDTAPELEARLRIGLSRQQAAEGPVQIVPESLREQLVAGVAQEMGEADLMRLCVVHLCAKAVANRNLQRGPFKEFSDHRFAAASRDAVRHRRARHRRGSATACNR